jgi:hypothetical protein
VVGPQSAVIDMSLSVMTVSLGGIGSGWVSEAPLVTISAVSPYLFDYLMQVVTEVYIGPSIPAHWSVLYLY